MRLAPLALALFLTGCPEFVATVNRVETDLAAVAAKAGSLCREVSPIVTLGDVAAGLSGNVIATEVMDTARAVQAKCVIIVTAQQSLQAGGSLASSAITLLSDPQAVADLASDVGKVKAVVK